MYHVLSELFTMTHPPWVALHSVAHSFIELGKPLQHNKAVIHEGDQSFYHSPNLFMGSKISPNDDCSHEIKGCFLLGRKAMTNLDSILKSSDITLPTKVHIVRTVVFPVVTYRCENWTIKTRLSAKELMPLNCGAGEDS